MKYSARTFLLALSTFLLLNTGEAKAEAGKEQQPKCDYVEYKRVPLTEKQHGIEGALVVMRDRSILSAEEYSFDDHETTCNARLYLEDSNNKRIETHELERPIARINTVNLISGRPNSFSLTVDYSAGSGWTGYKIFRRCFWKNEMGSGQRRKNQEGKRNPCGANSENGMEVVPTREKSGHTRNPVQTSIQE